MHGGGAEVNILGQRYRKVEGTQLAADSYYGSFGSQRRFVFLQKRAQANKLRVSGYDFYS